jgi:hypothetical protein
LIPFARSKLKNNDKNGLFSRKWEGYGASKGKIRTTVLPGADQLHAAVERHSFTLAEDRIWGRRLATGRDEPPLMGRKAVV